MRTPHPHSALRPRPLAAAIALALLPGVAFAADPARQPTATQAAPVVEPTDSGPFVVGTPQGLPPAKVAGPAVSVSSTYLDFGDVVVGGSRTLSTVFRSVGDSPYVINSIGNWYCGYGGYGGYGGFGPDFCSNSNFSCSTTCTPGQALSNGQSCSFTATFKPTYVGSAYTYFDYCDNTAATQPYAGYVDFYGFGAPPPVASIRPSSYDFGSVKVGTTSAPVTFSIINPRPVDAPIGQIYATGPFLVQSNNCPVPLPASARCSVTVVFNAAVAGPASGQLVVQSDAPFTYGGYALIGDTAEMGIAGGDSLAKGRLSYGGVQTLTDASAALTGNAIQFGSLGAPGSLDLGTYIFNTPALSQTATITNTSDVPVSLGTMTVTGPFSVANGCPSVLPVGGSCTLVVTFTSGTAGNFEGSINVPASIDAGSLTILLAARSQPVPIPEVRISPAALTFGNRVVGTTSDPLTIVVKNVGTAPASLSSPGASLDYVVTGNGCGATLAPQAQCEVQVAFQPVSFFFGPRIGTFTITSNSVGSPHVSTLIGTACRPYMGSRFTASLCSP